MAEIFLAADEQSYGGHRFVTIKRIRSDRTDLDYRDFFMTEARVALQCCHPNIPQVYEVGDVDGCLFLAMEYIHGHTLLSYLKAISKAGQMGSPSVAVTLGSAVAAALEHIHGLRSPSGAYLDVIHRDVSPQNVMVSSAGAVKLIDFGIVRSAIQIHQTQAGVVKGKFSYMAPETIVDPATVDHRADLFAVGVMLHEILTGRPLFRGRDAAATMKRVRRLPIPSISEMRGDVPPELEAVVEKALERDPDARFQTASELLEALEGTAQRSGIPLSMTQLRRDFRDACGNPEDPVFDGSIYSSAPEEDGRVARMAAGSDSESSAVATADTQSAAQARKRQPRASSSRIATDSELSYFLAKAGIISGSIDPGFNPLGD